nr:hypothetical protein HAGR004_37820 [Bdellovibrio sp. HAGR004]
MQQEENLERKSQIELGEQRQLKPVFFLFNGRHCTYRMDHEVVSVPIEQFQSILADHWQVVGFDIVNSIIEIERDLSTDLSFLFKESRIIDLKLLFQLVSLATDGTLFVPSNIKDLNTILRLRRLICSEMTDDDSIVVQHETIRVCYDYLHWKIRKIEGSNLLTQDIQVKADYALRKVERVGYHINRQQVQKLVTDTMTKIEQELSILASYGWRPGAGSEAKYEEIVNQLKSTYEIHLPVTKTGKVSSAERHLIELSESIPFFKSYLEFHSLRKLQSTYLDKLDTEILYPHYNTLVSTGRTSSYDPNFQNFPRDQEVRKCFIPQPGHKFLIADYSTIELCALAQTCVTLFGFSRMGELINQGEDLHRWFASIVLRKPQEEVTKQERAYAKACNFGFPGGLGVKQFLEYAKYTYGIDDLDLRTAKNFKSRWLEAFPEMNSYLSSEGHAYRTKATASTISGRMRAGCTFTQAKNFPFQSLAADGTKISLFNLVSAGFRVVNYIHDEFVIELTDNGQLNDRRHEAEGIMIGGMRTVLPDIEVRIESEVCDYWRKI